MVINTYIDMTKKFKMANYRQNLFQLIHRLIDTFSLNWILIELKPKRNTFKKREAKSISDQEEWSTPICVLKKSL